MTAASRSLATALWGARFASGSLPQSYTTNRDTTRSWFAQIRDIKLCAGSTDPVQRSFSGAVCRGATYLSP